jgi:hypothetical protein
MERLEILNAPNFIVGLDEALASLTDRNLANDNLDIPITIILKTTGEINVEGQRVVNVLTYIDATDNQILYDLDEN